jgi:hypothetical protein
VSDPSRQARRPDKTTAQIINLGLDALDFTVNGSAFFIDTEITGGNSLYPEKAGRRTP